MKSKIRNVKLLIALGVLLMSGSSYGQGKIVKQEQEYFKHSLGFGAGYSTGYGISYRYFGEKFGAQINFGPNKNGKELEVSTGLTFLYRILDLKDFTFYVYQGNNFYIKKEINKETKKIVEENYFNNGLGIAGEWVFNSHIGLNLMGGYSSRENFKKIGFTGEVAVYFKF
jgi:hypothetical protein